MEADEKWYFSKEQLDNTPSRKLGYDSDKELSCRQQAANFIQDMGQRLQVTQLCINTAIVYMHRFYVFHSFTRFHRNAIAAAALFLAAKVEEQPRKLEHVIKVAQMCLHREMPALDTKSEIYLDQASDLVVNENVLLQTLGFDVAIDHPHTHVVRCCHLVKASKDLAQTSYFMASNSLHLTTMCLQYKPTVVACFCIHLACKWSNWEIPLSNESKSWFWYVDKTVTQELLEQLTDEFLQIFDKCPSRLKRKISANQNMAGYHMGVNELNQKRLPGPSAGDPQHGVSFQHPIARHRNNADENRKKPDGIMLPPNHRQMAPPEPKKQPPHTATRDSGFGPYRGLPSTSQASTSHQVPSAQFLYPPPSIPGPSSNGPNSRLPNPTVPKHAVRPEAMFPPPKRSGHNMGPPAPRPVKTEFQAPLPQPPKAHSQSHHVPRNGTSHNLDNFAQTPVKTEPMPLKYPASVDKHSSNHQKGHPKIYDNPRGNQPVNWAPGDVTARSSMIDTKYIKSEIKNENITTSTSYHNIQGSLSVPSQMTTSSKPQTPPPPPPLPLLPPPPPPPPPPTPVQSSKPSSIFSPDKMTPPLPHSPSREGKCLSPLLLSPISSNKTGRNRTSSSSSEPELIPVMTKLEEMLGFESLAKGKTAIKLSGKSSNSEVKSKDSLQPKEKPKEVPTSHVSSDQKSSEAVHPVDGDITKPTGGDTKMIDVIDLTGSTKREHKKKKKHKEHREHRDKDKEKEKKKDKHKEKHREKDKDKYKHRGDPAPIKITIPKDKINNVIIQDKFPHPGAVPEQSGVLKIKIPKDKIMKTHIEQTKTPSSLKIKISKDAISSHTSSKSSSSSGSSSRKRERSSQRDNEEDSFSHTSKHAKLSKSTNGDLEAIV